MKFELFWTFLWFFDFVTQDQSSFFFLVKVVIRSQNKHTKKAEILLWFCESCDLFLDFLILILWFCDSFWSVSGLCDLFLDFVILIKNILGSDVSPPENWCVSKMPWKTSQSKFSRLCTYGKTRRFKRNWHFWTSFSPILQINCVKSIANGRFICFEDVAKNVPKSVFETLYLW